MLFEMLGIPLDGVLMTLLKVIVITAVIAGITAAATFAFSQLHKTISKQKYEREKKLRL